MLCVFGRVCKWKWNCYTIDKSIFHLTCDSHLILFFPVLPLFSYSPRCVEFYFRNPISRIAFFCFGIFFGRPRAFRFFSREIKLAGYSLRLWVEITSSKMSVKNGKNDDRITSGLNYTIHAFFIAANT